MKKFICLSLVVFMTVTLNYISFAKGVENLAFNEPEDLGAPIKTTFLLNGVISEEDGNPIACTSVSGEPGMFNVLDLETSTVLRSFTIPKGSTFWAHVVDSQGNVYVAGYLHPRLYKYSPKDKTFTDLGVIAGESAVCQMVVDEEDNVFIGTFPNAKLVKYDPKANKMMDLGNVLPGEKYLKSLAYYKGNLYGGGLAEGTKFVKINAKTFKKEVIPSPKTSSPIKSYYQASIAANRLFLYCETASSGNINVVYDLDKGQWVNMEISKANGLFVTPALNGYTYFPADGYVQKYDLAKDTYARTEQTYGTSFRGGGWVTLKSDDNFKEPAFCNFFYGGDIGMINFETKKTKMYSKMLQAAGSQVVSMAPYNDKVIVGGYMGTKAVEYDPDKKTVVKEFPMGQPESLEAFDGKYYFGGYPDADLKVYDPAKAVEKNINPAVLFDVKKEGQSRPFVVEKAGNHLALGTIADYGLLQGALSLYNMDTKEVKVYKNIVNNQSISGIAAKGNILYCSTTVWGGLGIDPSENEAKVFTFDISTGKKLKEVTLKHEAITAPMKMIGGLKFAPNGSLWGISDGIVFSLNPDTLTVEKAKKVDKYEWADYNFRWKPFSLEFDSQGILYANPRSTLYAIDTETLTTKKVLSDEFNGKVVYVKIKDDNTIYFFSDTKKDALFRVTKEGTGGSTGGTDFNNTVSLMVNQVKAVANGKELTLDVPATVFKDRTLVPVRFIAESLQAKVDWDEETETVTVTKGSDVLKIVIGESSLLKNGNKTDLDVPALLSNGRTLLPLRAVSESLGQKVFWDDRGLIIIGTTIPDKDTDGAYIEELILKLK